MTNNTIVTKTVTKRRNFIEMYVIAETIIIGNIRNTRKFIITLKFRAKIRKNNFMVVFGFKIVSFVDSHTAWKTFLSSSMRKNFAYENNIFIIIQNTNKNKNI